MAQGTQYTQPGQLAQTTDRRKRVKHIVNGIEMIVCQRERSRGTYWYGYWNDEHGRKRSCYIGKKLPPLPSAPRQGSMAFRCVVCHGYPTHDPFFVICPRCRERVIVQASKKRNA
jgi:hypothetical protein